MECGASPGRYSYTTGLYTLYVYDSVARRRVYALSRIWCMAMGHAAFLRNAGEPAGTSLLWCDANIPGYLHAMAFRSQSRVNTLLDDAVQRGDDGRLVRAEQVAPRRLAAEFVQPAYSRRWEERLSEHPEARITRGMQHVQRPIYCAHVTACHLPCGQIGDRSSTEAEDRVTRRT